MRKCKKCNEIKKLDQYYTGWNNILSRRLIIGTCITCYNLKRKQNYNENVKLKNNERTRQWRKKNPDYNKKYRELNPDYFVNYRKTNRGKINAKEKEDMKKPFQKLRKRLRRRLLHALHLKAFKKTSKFAEYIGCTPEELKQHIKSQFREGMTWENHGVHGWHIDHIIPLSSASNEEELFKLCHYTNLRPLWAFENLSKHNKIKK